ncbi:cache domain-containing protein [Halomicroarcula sp. GCM10025709]|uniref:cache domain-containing protein n=1 Tax=Halomicroarcula sp. GCM10025709 TaxID=3252669 RepID=UPI00361598AD
MHLRTTFLVTLAAVALVLSGIVFAGFSLHKQEITSQERATLDASTTTVAHDLDTRLAEKQSTVALWASNDATAAHGTRAQRDALATFRAETAFEGVSVVAANGTMVAINASGLPADRREALTGADFSTRPYVQAALDGERYVSAPFEAESGNFIVTISAPIRRDGTVVGTLNSAFHLTATNFFESSTTLLHPEQSLIVRSTDGTQLYADPLPDGDRLTATDTVGETGWTVTVAVDRAAVAQPVRQATTYQFGALGLTLLAVAVLGIWASRLTIRQIDELVAGFDALESGNYGTTVELGGRRSGSGSRVGSPNWPRRWSAGPPRCSCSTACSATTSGTTCRSSCCRSSGSSTPTTHPPRSSARPSASRPEPSRSWR